MKGINVLNRMAEGSTAAARGGLLSSCDIHEDEKAACGTARRAVPQGGSTRSVEPRGGTGRTGPVPPGEVGVRSSPSPSPTLKRETAWPKATVTAVPPTGGLPTLLLA